MGLIRVVRRKQPKSVTEASTNHRGPGSRGQVILREVLRTIDPEVQLVLLRGQELVPMTVQPATI